MLKRGEDGGYMVQPSKRLGGRHKCVCLSPHSPREKEEARSGILVPRVIVCKTRLVCQENQLNRGHARGHALPVKFPLGEILWHCS